MKSLTYLVYIVFWQTLVWGGCSYLVFWRDASPWWFLLALFMAGSAYRPGDWATLET